MDQSPKFTLNGADIWKTVRGTLITLAAVVLTSVLSYVAAAYQDWNYVVCMDTLCFDFRLLAIPVIGGGLEAGRRWLAGQK